MLQSSSSVLQNAFDEETTFNLSANEQKKRRYEGQNACAGKKNLISCFSPYFLNNFAAEKRS
jgi:hypothetical protein